MVKRIQQTARRWFEAIVEERVNDLVKTWACNCMTPEEHDAVLALAARLPEALSVALANTALSTTRTDESDGNCNRIRCDGPSETTCLALNDPAIWREILATNGENVRRMLAALEGRTRSLDPTVSEQQIEQIQELFEPSLVSKTA
ncbi:MAG: prephenate dehydrogenase dimerization domain-containing protein [Candidatus Korobacteraceae bacterium]|jgi:prephenate dehydrogenase